MGGPSLPKSVKSVKVGRKLCAEVSALPGRKERKDRIDEGSSPPNSPMGSTSAQGGVIPARLPVAHERCTFNTVNAGKVLTLGDLTEFYTPFLPFSPRDIPHFLDKTGEKPAYKPAWESLS